MESPNRMALDLVDEAIDFAEELNVGVHHLENEAVVLDFGVDYPGGVEAGLLLTEIATGGLSTVQARVGTVDSAALTHVELATDHPALSLLGCQTPGWEFDIEGATARGSGPAQLFRRTVGATVKGDADERDSSPDEPGIDLDYEEEFDFAVLVLESDRLPGESLVEEVASVTGVPTSGVFVLVAPATSVVGSVSFAARAAERSVHRLAMAGYAPRDVLSVHGSAPAAPLARTGAEARERSAAAIAGGGRVHVVVEDDLESPAEIVQSRPDDELPTPAQVTIDVADGATHVVGGVDEGRLAEALGL